MSVTQSYITTIMHLPDYGFNTCSTPIWVCPLPLCIRENHAHRKYPLQFPPLESSVNCTTAALAAAARLVQSARQSELSFDAPPHKWICHCALYILRHPARLRHVLCVAAILHVHHSPCLCIVALLLLSLLSFSYPLCSNIQSPPCFVLIVTTSKGEPVAYNLEYTAST